MTILLTEPLAYPSVQGRDAETLREIKIAEWSADLIEKCVTITTRYGNTIEGLWVSGSAPGKSITVRNEPAQFDPDDLEHSVEENPRYSNLILTKVLAAVIVALAQEDPVEDLYVYNLVSDGLYQFLLDEGHYEGTIQ